MDEWKLILVAHMAALKAKKCVTEAEGYRGGGVRIKLPGQRWVLVKAMQEVVAG